MAVTVVNMENLEHDWAAKHPGGELTVLDIKLHVDEKKSHQVLQRAFECSLGDLLLGNHTQLLAQAGVKVY